MMKDIYGNDVNRPDGTAVVSSLTDTGDESPAYYRVVPPGLIPSFGWAGASLCMQAERIEI